MHTHPHAPLTFPKASSSLACEKQLTSTWLYQYHYWSHLFQGVISGPSEQGTGSRVSCWRLAILLSIWLGFLCDHKLSHFSPFSFFFLDFSCLFSSLMKCEGCGAGATVDVFRAWNWGCICKDGMWGIWEHQGPVGMVVKVSSIQKVVSETNNPQISRLNFEGGNHALQKTSWKRMRMWPVGRPRPTSETRCCVTW